jgi:hypothetical protein
MAELGAATHGFLCNHKRTLVPVEMNPGIGGKTYGLVAEKAKRISHSGLAYRRTS